MTISAENSLTPSSLLAEEKGATIEKKCGQLAEERVEREKALLLSAWEYPWQRWVERW